MWTMQILVTNNKMKFAKENLNLEKGLNKEWVITNGLGGFASSTIIGANTRRYHGLLIAPLMPPARRTLILSKLDESIEINGNKTDLYTNIGKNFITHGYKYQECFIKEYIPIFAYKVGDVEITKAICMQHFKNTVAIFYKVKNGSKKAKLILTPVMDFRNAHGMNKDHVFDLKQKINKTKLEVKIDNGVPIYMMLSEGNYIEHYNDTFKNMFYIEEEKRGFEAEENHVIPGRFEIEIEPNEEKEISVICSLEENIEELDARAIITNEIVRQNQEFAKSKLIDISKEDKTEEEEQKDKLIKQFLIAIDNFIIIRPFFNTYSMIAGYPWFLDWGRDTLIAFEGLLLVTKRFKIAKEVLKTMIRDIKFGLVPNGYSGYDNRPLYNSADASLLLFEQVKKFLNYTKDYNFVEENIYKSLIKVIESYINGINHDNNNIWLDKDGLLVAGTEHTQNTWMDAKYDGVAITPRSGKAVEVNSLWYNANKIMADLSKKFGHSQNAKKYKLIAEKCKKSFNDKFYNKRRKCLYDVLGDSKIRPNQLFALSLTYPVIEADSEEAKNIISVVEKKLLNAYGLKTLAKGEENYVEVYEGDGKKRDSSYHQGITWPWLLGLYYNALKNILKKTKKKDAKKELETKLEKFIEKTSKTFQKEISHNGCIGSISELYDSRKPYLPKGTIAQAWSVAEVFRIILNK